MREIKVAYIVPIYNANRYLRQCLQSLADVRTKKEVILIDDCGSEDPSEIVNFFLKKYDSFRYFKNEKNVGVGFSRNNGIERISDDTTHVYFVDNDDYVDAEKIDFEVENNLKKEMTMFHSQYMFLTKKNSFPKKSTPFISAQNYKNQKVNLPVYTWGTFWAREHIKNGRFTTRFFEEMPFLTKFLEVTDKFELIGQPTYYYRQRKSSFVNSPDSADNLYDFVIQINALSKSKHILDKERQISLQLKTLYKRFWSCDSQTRREAKEYLQKLIDRKKRLFTLAHLLKILSSFKIEWSSTKKTDEFFE